MLPDTRSGSSVEPWLTLGLDFVFPPSCAACQVSIDTSAMGLLCPACRTELADTRGACARCGSPGPPNQSGECPRCHNQQFYFSGVARLGTYEGALRSAVLQVKRRDHRGLAIALGDLLAGRHGDQLRAWRPDAIVPVPMHWTRRLVRGCNCPTTIAQRLAAYLDVPLADHLLVRRRRTAPQARLTPPRRRANVRGAFGARRHPDLPGSRLLLVDDIMTTGATVNEAARTLLRAGASFVAVAVLARAIDLA